MSSSQTSIWHNREAPSLPSSSRPPLQNKEAKSRLLTAMGRPDLDQTHLLVAFRPLLPYPATNKLMSYFPRAELKKGSARES